MNEEADKWKSLRSEFRRLALEEEQEREGLSVYGNYEKHPCGEWTYNPHNRHEIRIDLGAIISVESGLSSDLEEQFRAHATRAGMALGHPKDTTFEFLWLHGLFTYLLKHNRQELVVGSNKGVTILRACKSSATYCAWLERQALEYAEAGRMTREALRVILKKKGLSVHDWATKAGVDFHTADNYLKGKTKPYPSTRKKLAAALGVETKDLPA